MRRVLQDRVWFFVVCCVVCGGATADPLGKPVNDAAPLPTPTVPSASDLTSPKGSTQFGSPPLASKDTAAPAPTLPDEYKLNMLIRTTIIAVNQANKTGNYSVLRDLGSPAFQNANSMAKLTEIFSGQRNANLDLSPIVFFEPKLIRAPSVDENGMLRLTGFFATAPQQINFDLAFEYFQGEWRHFGVGVSTGPTAAPDAPSKAPAQVFPTPK